MKNNKKIFGLVFILVLIISVIIFGAYIKNIQKGIIINNNIVQQNNIKKSNGGKENINIKDKIISPTLFPKEQKQLAIKNNFNDSCSEITSNEQMKKLLEKNTVNIDESTRKLVYSYIDNTISLSKLENKLLEKIGETDDENMKEQRLYLNYIFLILNDIKRGNTTNCDNIFTQYYK